MRLKAKQSEADFQAQVIELARHYRWRCAHFRGVRVQRKDGSVYYQTPVQAQGKGFPDLVLLKGARLLVAELKIPPNTVTPEQAEWLDAFRAVPGAMVCTWTPADWLAIERILASDATP